ncbi:hypothetical protein [Plantactinospora sonchi]|uniref:Uncharacterized protein n=1 Tax=Plantactinospora sonchi TaxID=1544735 RepID=A0ABU7RN59_9ACTN
MKPPHPVGVPERSGGAPEPVGDFAVRRTVLRAHPAMPPAPDEPLAVVAVGPAGADRRAVLAGLLGIRPSALRMPPESFLVFRYGPDLDVAVQVPGLVGGAPGRPPRRIDLAGPEPLLRHFHLVNTPDPDTLGVAGRRIVRDAVRRGGALLFVLPAGHRVTAADVELLGEVAGEAAIFLVGTPGGDGGWSSADPDADGIPDADEDETPEEDEAPDGVGAGTVDLDGPRDLPGGGPADGAAGAAAYWDGVDRRRAELVDQVPALAGLPWLDLDPTDPAYLRRALIDWASAEGLRRASRVPPVVPGFGRTVPVAPEASGTGWADLLDRRIRTCVHRLRREIALEAANIHLRGVQGIVDGTGVAGLPGFLDREVEALALDVMAACDAEVDRILGESLRLVFGEEPDDGVRLRAAAAVGQALADRAGAGESPGALLLRETGEVEPADGAGTAHAPASYPGCTAAAILPPLGIGLGAECYGYWREPRHAEPGRARSWLQRALREIELELSREVSRRFEAVRGALAAVLTDAIRHGRLRG